MKNFWKAAGGAALCFVLYIAVQTAVCFVAVFVQMMNFILENGLDFIYDYSQMSALTAQLMAQTNAISAVSNGLYLAGLAAVYALRKKKITQELQLRACTPMSLMMSVVYGFGICFVISFLTDLIPFSEQMEDSFSSTYALLDQGSPIVAFLATVLLAPVAEEVLFRGLIHGKLRKGMPVWLAVVVSSLIFGLMHGELIWVLHAFLAGVALAWIYEQTHSLWPCILVHFTNNLISQIMSWTGDPQPWLNWVLVGIGAVALVGSVVYLIRNRTPEPEEQQVCRADVQMPASAAYTPRQGKTVLILGDSLRLGYGPVVRRLLTQVASVVYPMENCRNTQYTYVNLPVWKNLVVDPAAVRVIYWNNGHWDIAHWDDDSEPLNDIDTYCRMLLRIADKLRSQYPNAQIVFATTTPMNPDVASGRNPRTTEEIRAYNAAAVALLQQHGVVIDDLFAQLEDKPSSLYADHCHLSAEGCEYLGAHVAETIWRLLETVPETPGQELLSDGL